MITIAATSIIGALAVLVVDLPSKALTALDDRHDERAATMFVSVEFIERQQYHQQLERYDGTLNRNELEAARPNTSEREKQIYRRQNRETQLQKEQTIRDWQERHGPQQ